MFYLLHKLRAMKFYILNDFQFLITFSDNNVLIIKEVD